MIEVDINKLIEYTPKLDKFKGELPLKLIFLVNRKDYFNRISIELKDKILSKREEYQYCEDYIKFLDDDIKEWLKDNPEFKDLFIMED